MHIQLTDGILTISGEVTVGTLTPARYREFEQACQTEPKIIDWSSVDKADSAGLSLLLLAMRTAKQQPPSHHLPPSLKALAGLYEISDWIDPARTVQYPNPIPDPTQSDTPRTAL